MGGAAQLVEQSDIQLGRSGAVARPPAKPAATRSAVPIGRASLPARRVGRVARTEGARSSRFPAAVPELWAASLGVAGSGISGNFARPEPGPQVRLTGGWNSACLAARAFVALLIIGP
jgi:hypothetical protein